MAPLSAPNPLESGTATPDETAIHTLASKSHGLADELLDMLKKLKGTPNGHYTTWASLRVAVRAGLKKSKIRKLQTDLQDIQVQINTHLLSMMK